MKKKLLSLLLVIAVIITGCASAEANTDFITDETKDTVTYIDSFGNETTVTKNPERVVVLFNSILGLWYESGGESLTKVKGTTNVPEEATELIDLGSSYSVSLEAIVALEPDLVVIAANVDSQVSLVPSLKEIGIETIIIDTSYRSYDRYRENAKLFAKINNTPDIYETNIAPVEDKVAAIIKKVSEEKQTPRVASVMASSKSLKLDSNIALTGEIVELLGGENILNEANILTEGETRVDFSIESLVTFNPEYILISTMGDVDAAKAQVQTMIEANPAWFEVDAVKNGKVYYLPKDLFVYKPNSRYDEAFLYLAEILYPELY